MVDGHRRSASSSPSCGCRPTRSCRASPGSTSGSSAARRCWCSCSSGTTSRPSCSRSRSASRSVPAGSSPTTRRRSSPSSAAACLGLGLNEAAYMAEIARAGILSVDEGQVEAASALGMTRLPDDAPHRAAAGHAGHHPADRQRDHLDAQDHVAGLGDRLIELLYAAQIIYGRNFQIIPLLIVASIWYLFMTSILTIGQYYIERRFARGAQREPPAHPAPEAAPADPPGREPWRDRADRAHGAGRGGPQELRAARGAQGHRPRGRAPGRVLPGRALGLGQVHVPALHQPPREDRRRPALGRRRAGRLPAEGRQALRAARPRGLPEAPGDRHGLPELQPLPAHDGAGQRDGGTVPGEGRGQGHRPRAGREAARPGRPGRQGRRATRPSSPAASSSGWPSPGPWPWSPS